jgi:hypothetical protein
MKIKKANNSIGMYFPSSLRALDQIVYILIDELLIFIETRTLGLYIGVPISRPFKTDFLSTLKYLQNLIKTKKL